MIKDTIDFKDKIKMFLNEYYFGYGPLISLIRVLSGPLLIYMAINKKGDSSYSIFTLVFGIYFIIRPLILILTQKKFFEELDRKVDILDSKVIVESGESRAEISYNDFKKILKRKKYYVLRTHANQSIYIPNYKLNKGESEILNKVKSN